MTSPPILPAPRNVRPIDWWIASGTVVDTAPDLVGPLRSKWTRAVLWAAAIALVVLFLATRGFAAIAPIPFV